MRWSIVAALALLLLVPLASAHVTQTVGPFTVKVGWASEPAASNARNGIIMQVWRTANGQGVTGLVDTLKMTAILGDARKDLALAESDESPGNYSAPILPTQAGLYVIHVQGTIAGQASIGNDFHLEEVTDGSADAFPSTQGQPTTQELQVEIQQLKTELDQVRTQKTQVPGLGAIGAIGALALVALAVRARK